MLIFCDDGETGIGNLLYTDGNANGSHPTPGKDGSYGINGSGVGAFYSRKYFGSTYTELFFSMFVRLGSNTDSRILTWYSDATELGSIRWKSSNKHFEIYTSTGTLQATGTVTQQEVTAGGSWFNLNIRVYLHDSSGVIEVRHEGSASADVTWTGDTLPSGTTMNGVLLGNIAGNTGHWYDDFWVNDISGAQNNSWPGVLRSSTQFPTGKSATNDSWIADSGTNKWDRIDEQPYSAADYVYSQTAGHKQGFTYAAPVFVGTIVALVMNDVGVKVSQGSVKQGVRIASTDYASSTKALLTTIARGSVLQHYLELNPNTGVAWLTSENPESYLEKV